jgi:long-chain acyl-CoA synthetase
MDAPIGTNGRRFGQAEGLTMAAAAWTVASLVRSMEHRGDAPAILSLQGGRTEAWSFGRLAKVVRDLSAGLGRAGLATGEPAAIYAPNMPEWVGVALALNTVGALVVPLDDLVDEQHTETLLVDSGAKWIFTTRSHLAGLRKMRGAQDFRLFLLDAAEGAGDGAESWLSLLAETSVPEFDVQPDQAACLFYTSGTTGTAKGFILTHANIGTNVQALVAEGLVSSGDRALLPLPLHHAYPYIVGMLAALESGMAIVLPESVSGPHMARALQAARVTAIVGVPRLYAALLVGIRARVAAYGRFAERCFSLLLALCVWAHRRLGLALGRWLLGPIRRQVAPDLRLLISGDADLSWALEAIGWEVLAGYGLAETGSVFSGNLPRRKRLGSAGTPIGDGKVRISKPDEAGVGEIELRGSSITRGYRGNPEANRAAFTEDGWFRTGDLGYVDEDGFLFVTGRVKEAIVLGGGKKVDPEALESIYAASPVIAEIAILERGGQLVALVRPDAERLREIGTLNVAQVVRVAVAEIAQKLPSYQRLAGLAVAARPLPRTRLGKYQRFLLPTLYDQAQRGVVEAASSEPTAQDRELLADPIAAAAWDLVSRRYAAKRPTLDSHLALELGVDSLEWMGLSVELEGRSGVTLSDEDLAAVDTVRDLLAALARTGADPAAGAAREQRLSADKERWLTPAGPLLSSIGLTLFGLNKLLMRLLFRLRVEGPERLPPSGPFLLVSNHASDLDPLAIAAALPYRRFRQLYWAGDRSRLFRSPVVRSLCRAVRLYPIDERTPASGIDMASSVLERGNAQVWFPEGWRSPDGRLQRFLPGIGALLVRTRVPAVPVYVSGTFQAMSRTQRWPRLHAIRVAFGAPQDPEALAARGRGASPEESMADALQQEVRTLAAGIGEDV